MDSRILGIIGGALVIIGIFLPVVTVSVAQAGVSQTISVFDSIKAGSWEGYVLMLAGIASIVLAVLRKYRFLIVTGAITLILVLLNLVNLKSGIAKSLGLPSADALDLAGVEVTTQWLGWIVLFLGALVLIAAGAMGRNLPAPGPNYGAPPPPPPPYPGR